MGHIYIHQGDYPNLFTSTSRADIELANGRRLVTFAGIVRLRDLQGVPPMDNYLAQPDYRGTTSDAWRQDTLHLQLDLPPSLVQQGKTFKIESCVPLITLNSVYNGGEAINAGWAVDTCALENIPLVGAVQVRANIAVRDSDGILYRIGYFVTMSGLMVNLG